jgi:hypothetical protein
MWDSSLREIARFRDKKALLPRKSHVPLPAGRGVGMATCRLKED